MKIAHASDLHGDLGPLTLVTEHPDLWVLTGDFFPSRTRGDRRIEEPFQNWWFVQNAATIAHRFQGVPVFVVPGNHDFADLTILLRRVGVKALEVTPQGCTFSGLRFAGFGQIPFIVGEWNREATMSQLALLTRRTMELGNPDVLVTHAPPDGILNGDYQGLSPLTSWLAYRPHRVKLHLFGHNHENGGRQVEHMGIRFVNSACCSQVINI